MTREDVARELRMMEQVRHDSYEAETSKEEKRLTSLYGKMAKAIEPYITGKKPYSEPRT